MSEVLNIDRLHRNGKPELEIGLRGSGFIIKRDVETDDIIIVDLKNNKSYDLSSTHDTINKLHYYSSKDIVINESIFVLEGSLLKIKCSNLIDGILVVPYTLGNHENVVAENSNNVMKIIIPRGMNLINSNLPMDDEALVNMFPNLKIIVRIHADGAVLSYNVETAELN